MSKINRAPNVWKLRDLIASTDTIHVSRDGHHYYPGRPIGLDTIGNRVRCAWMVFTGRADAVIWPEGQ